MKKTLMITIITMAMILGLAMAAAPVSAASYTGKIMKGQTKTLTVKGFEDPQFESSNTAVATVTKMGNKVKITAKKSGTTTITAEETGYEMEVADITVETSEKFVNASGCYTKLNNYRAADKKAQINKINKSKAKKTKKNKQIKKINKTYKTTLKRDANLEKIAKIRAEEMAKSGKFSHTRPNGQSGLTLIKGNIYKGENIAMGQTTCDQVSTAWFKSPGHKKNMLKQQYTKVGIAGFEYNGVIYWAQVFSS